MLDVHLRKQRRELEIEVSFNLAAGKALALFGASGAGKSTVLNCIAGIEDPDFGFIRFESTSFFQPSLALRKRRTGYLTQEPNLFPHLRVRENILFGVGAGWKHDPEQRSWIEELRDGLHLAPLWEASAARLSGGQARRVALARMLAPRPKLVLLDEPFGGLDRQLTRELTEHLVRWQSTLRFSMVVVDHQAEILQRLCPERVIAMEDGRILQDGSWARLHAAPASPLLASLLAPL